MCANANLAGHKLRRSYKKDGMRRPTSCGVTMVFDFPHNKERSLLFDSWSSGSLK